MTTLQPRSLADPPGRAGQVWVVDTSPLSFLAKLGHLELLKTGAETTCVAQVVVDETQAKLDDAACIISVACESWLSIRQVANRQAVEILLADLGPGEAETIVLARGIKADRVVMDDLDARRFARRVGLKPIGTLGLLLAARLQGKVPSRRREIARLEATGFRVAPDLVEGLLQEAGEAKTG